MAPGRRAHLPAGPGPQAAHRVLGQAGELETKALARRAQAEGKLPAAQVQARQTRVLAREELNNEIAAAHQQLQEKASTKSAGRPVQGPTRTKHKQSKLLQHAPRRPDRHSRPSRAASPPNRTRWWPRQPGAFGCGPKHTSAIDRRQEADHLDQLATKRARRTPLQLIGLRSLIRTGPPFSDSCHTLPCRAMRLPVGSGGGIGYDAIPQQLTSPPHRDPAQLPDRGRGRTEWIISVCLPARLEYSIVALACLFSWRRAACHAAIGTRASGRRGLVFGGSGTRRG